MVTIISKRPTNIEIIESYFDESRREFINVRSVKILGGAGVMDAKTLVTPEGVATEITDEAYAWLKQQPKFIKGVNAGIFKALEHTKARTIDADEEASKGDMEKNENIPGRPLTPEQLAKDGAVINKDGSVDVSNGGRNAPSLHNQHLDNVRREKARGKRGRK